MSTDRELEWLRADFPEWAFARVDGEIVATHVKSRLTTRSTVDSLIGFRLRGLRHSPPGEKFTVAGQGPVRPERRR
jgi:hypothetical protein